MHRKGKMTRLTKQAVILVAASTLALGHTYAAISASDDFIMPSAATAQHGSRLKAINGSGMSETPVTPTSTCDTAGTSMWISNIGPVTWIAFDLGAEKTVTGFHLWNYNEDSTTFIQRAVKSADLYVCPSLPGDGVAFSPDWGDLIQNFTFAQGTRSATYTGEDYPLTTRQVGRYFLIRTLSNYSQDYPQTGFSEIRFYAAAPDLTRRSSGGKVIASSVKEGYRVIEEGTGESIEPLTLEAATTTISTLYVAATEEPVVVDLAEQTLVLAKIQLQGNAGGLVLDSGTLKSVSTNLWVYNQSANPVTIQAVIADGSSVSSLTKSGSGSLRLSRANTYSGATVVNDGTLVLTSTAALPKATDLFMSSNATLELTVSQSALTLTLGEVLYERGTWGALGSDAQSTSPQFTGAGILHLGPAPRGTIVLIQ